MEVDAIMSHGSDQNECSIGWFVYTFMGVKSDVVLGYDSIDSYKV